jgi:hypothetical protein
MHPTKKRYLLKKEQAVWQAIKDAQTAMSKSRMNFGDPGTLKAFLTRVSMVNKQAGFLAWDPGKLKQDPVAEPGAEYPRLRPVSSQSLWVDAFAGSLFGRGYDIYFDRDPRNIDKLTDWLTVLRRMSDCNYFVSILTDQYIQRITDPHASGPLVAEWKHALMMYPDHINFIGIRKSDMKLPKPFTRKNTIDVRKNHSAWGENIKAVFPDGGIPTIPPPNRPADPPHWPAYIPY